MIKKLIYLVKHYDVLKNLIENEEKSLNKNKRYSVKNVPKEQLEYIDKIKKQGK